MGGARLSRVAACNLFCPQPDSTEPPRAMGTQIWTNCASPWGTPRDPLLGFFCGRPFLRAWLGTKRRPCQYSGPSPGRLRSFILTGCRKASILRIAVVMILTIPGLRRLGVHFGIPGPPPKLHFDRLPESVDFKDSCSNAFDDSGPPAARDPFRHLQAASVGSF